MEAEGANQALEQTRDSVLRYGEVVGCELLNFFVRQYKKPRARAVAAYRQGCGRLEYPARRPVDRMVASAACGVSVSLPCGAL
jgi:hypothetical protein